MNDNGINAKYIRDLKVCILIYNIIKNSSQIVASIMLSPLELLDLLEDSDDFDVGTGADDSSVLEFLFLCHLAEGADGSEQEDSSKRRKVQMAP